MRRIIIPLLLFIAIHAQGQYNSEKIKEILAGKSQKSWAVTGLNIVRPEKSFTFKTDNTGVTEDNYGSRKPMKWSLKSTDNIRYFITIGNANYELIISYDKKGEQYIKLTHSTVDNKTSGYYEIKLTPIK
jgi:hypothetical protein